MARPADFLKRHSLLMGFGAVLVPLLVLLALQYRWLASLEQVTAIAHKAALNNYLEAVANEVQFFYRSSAERALNLPASLFLDDQLEMAATSWEKKPLEGARKLFLVDFTREHYGRLLAFDPSLSAFDTALAPPDSIAITAACSPWRSLGPRGRVVESVGLKVDERNRACRMILNPIIDDSAHVAGIAGMILDEEYFKLFLLPRVIQKAFPGYFPDAARNDLVVSVRDAAQNLVMSSRSMKVQGHAVSRSFPFVFTDWTLNLDSGPSTPEQYARANFGLNITLSVLLAVVLMAGIVLALRTASRTIRLSEMKSDFVSNVSHELRTPLASIRVFAELLRLGRAQTSERVQEYGEYIEAESRRLSALIDNILDFSRIESGRKTYRFGIADLRDVIRSTLQTLEVQLRHSDFRLTCQGLDGPPLPVNMDAAAIEQALTNLLDNAVKYSGDSRDILVRMERDGDGAVVSVQDKGIGIARDEQKKIFERFHRVGSGLVHDVKGSGLGLSIVHHIVAAHRGRVTVESEPGKGSTFSIHLPLEMEGAVEAEAGEAAGAGRAAAPEIAGGPATTGHAGAGATTPSLLAPKEALDRRPGADN